MPPSGGALASILPVMNMLNECALNHPDAISFLSGSPATVFQKQESWPDMVDTFCRWQQAQGGGRGVHSLTQYGRTNGIINPLIAEWLRRDHGVVSQPEDILVTAGAQEAFGLILDICVDARHDVLLVPEHCYVGILGACALRRISVQPVAVDELGINPSALAASADSVRTRGMRPRALYAMSDFENPSAISMPLVRRQALLDECARQQLLVIEDATYSLLSFSAERIPALRTLDGDGRVVYVGTFSKTIAPGLRVGFLVADTATRSLLEQLSVAKSFASLNTSPYCQAIVGGRLIREDFSLQSWVRPAIEHYRSKRDQMLQALSTELDGDSFSWNTPAGGFFLSLQTGRAIDRGACDRAARSHGVLFLPMTLFAAAGAPSRTIRLSFSSVAPERISDGVRRLARFLRDDMGGT